MSPPSARRDAAVISARAAVWATDAPREARSRARQVTARVPALRAHGWPAREAWAARVAHAYRVLVSVQGDRRRGEP